MIKHRHNPPNFFYFSLKLGVFFVLLTIYVYVLCKYMHIFHHLSGFSDFLLPLLFPIILHFSRSSLIPKSFHIKGSFSLYISAIFITSALICRRDPAFLICPFLRSLQFGKECIGSPASVKHLLTRFPFIIHIIVCFLQVTSRAYLQHFALSISLASLLTYTASSSLIFCSCFRNVLLDHFSCWFLLNCHIYTVPAPCSDHH